ncbi:N-acetyltransferase [uncultured Paenibacillus sp.]|uniref:GNAT family N-acetyltransferase n=1 Tax=uncultured Paenibacillus sp. TaxID=227322 RepID=UPI0015B2A304|nr:GNAT family N-acetyltransferase [uncultured Paenibacillus sp.]
MSSHSHEIVKLSDISPELLVAIRTLEQICRQADGSKLQMGLDNLTKDSGDHAYLYQIGGSIAGCLIWYTADGVEANLNAMVHPERRRQGVFRRLLEAAAAEMGGQGIQTCRFKVPADSEPGLHCAERLGARLAGSQFAMELAAFREGAAGHPDLKLRPEELEDFGFMVRCMSQAFGDDEGWTLRYLGHTREPGRHNYIGCYGEERIGLIRVNLLGGDAAVIHDFCVLPSRQGRGYGREMLAQTVRLLLAQGHTRIRLSVAAENRSALELYSKTGFSIVSESRYYVCKLKRGCPKR